MNPQNIFLFPERPALPLVGPVELRFLTDAEADSFRRQNPELYEAIRKAEGQPIAYDNGIDPDPALIRAAGGEG